MIMAPLMFWLLHTIGSATAIHFFLNEKTIEDRNVSAHLRIRLRSLL
jgi:hypothetical protein